MADNLKESVSAFIDGEATEIEVHRLLREYHADNSLKHGWVSYQQVRAVVRGEHVLDAERHHSLSASISEAISAEETYSNSKGQSRPAALSRWQKPAAGFAIAASLVVAVFVGMNIPRAGDTGVSGPAAIASAPATAQPGAAQPNAVQPIAAQTVSTNSAPQQFAMRSGVEELELKELDEEKQRVLRAYLNQHDRMARLNPNVRAVTLDAPEGK